MVSSCNYPIKTRLRFPLVDHNEEKRIEREVFCFCTLSVSTGNDATEESMYSKRVLGILDGVISSQQKSSAIRLLDSSQMDGSPSVYTSSSMTNREEQHPARVNKLLCSKYPTQKCFTPFGAGDNKEECSSDLNNRWTSESVRGRTRMFRLSAVSSIRSLLDHTSEHSARNC